MQHPVDIHVGRQLRVKRTLQGLTQEVVGKSLGITFQQLQKYEKGTNRISASKLYELSRILSCSPSYFYEGLGEETEDTQIMTRETLEMVRAYYLIDKPGVRKHVLELIKALKNKD